MSEKVIRQELDPEVAAVLTPENSLPTITDESYPPLHDAMGMDDGTARAAAEALGLIWEDHDIDVEGGTITVSVIRPATRVENSPLYVTFHSGGMVLGNHAAGFGVYDEFAWVQEHNMILVTPNYRLAPEFPAPTGVEDCYATLLWAVSQGKKWGVDPERIMVGGASGGGGLAAGVALLARDRGEVSLFAQCLIYPMIDDRNTTVSSQQFTEPHGKIWPRESNVWSWNALLGAGHEDRDDVSIYIAPARATDLSGLPTTYIDVATAEVFRDEDIAYATRLLATGIQTELHVWRGGFHGFDALAFDTTLAKEARTTRSNWMRRILA